MDSDLHTSTEMYYQEYLSSQSLDLVLFPVILCFLLTFYPAYWLIRAYIHGGPMISEGINRRDYVLRVATMDFILRTTEDAEFADFPSFGL